MLCFQSIKGNNCVVQQHIKFGNFPTYHFFLFRGEVITGLGMEDTVHGLSSGPGPSLNANTWGVSSKGGVLDRPHGFVFNVAKLLLSASFPFSCIYLATKIVIYLTLITTNYYHYTNSTPKNSRFGGVFPNFVPLNHSFMQQPPFCNPPKYLSSSTSKPIPSKNLRTTPPLW